MADRALPHLNMLLSGVVGSRAYGLDHPGSDHDVLGVYAAPTAQFLGLYEPQDTFVTRNPDVTLHEVAKFCRLALSCNPTVTELLWLDQYLGTTEHGIDLIAMRRAFLSAGRVRSAYLGYAGGQLRKLEGYLRRYPIERSSYGPKQVRHMARLIIQGFGLYSTGRLRVRLTDEQIADCRRLEAAVVAGDTRPATALFEEYQQKFARARAAIPERPDTDKVDRWLRGARRKLIDVPGPDLERKH